MNKIFKFAGSILAGILSLGIFSGCALFTPVDSEAPEVSKPTSTGGETSDEPDPTTKAYNIKVMSVNLAQDASTSPKRAERYQKTLDKMIDASPDLIGVQEETYGWREYLQSNLEEYGYVHEVTFRGNPPYDEASGIFWSADRFKLLDSGTFWLSPTPNQQSVATEWGGMFPRVCTWVKLEDKLSGEAIAYLNTHFEYSTNLARVESAKLINAKAEELGVPCFFSGDLNFAYDRDSDQEEYNMILQAFGDSRIDAEDSDKGYTFHGCETVTDNYNYHRVLDYIFYTKDYFLPQKFEVIRETGIPGDEHSWASDHYCVACQFSFEVTL